MEIPSILKALRKIRNHGILSLETAMTPEKPMPGLRRSFANVQDIPNTFFAGDGVDPRHWNMVTERTSAGETLGAQPLERPVLYRRGDARAK